MRVRVPPLAPMSLELARLLRILGRLNYHHRVDLTPVGERRVKPTDNATVLDVETSFFKPVSKGQTLDGLRADPEGSDSVE